jgi:hypothetical protein
MHGLQVRLLVLPNLELYLHLLAPELSPETQQNEMKRYEAWRVYGALLVGPLFALPPICQGKVLLSVQQNTVM